MALTGLDWHLFNWRQLEFHGKLCFMKAGLVFADMLSTVSPTYAREIQTPRSARDWTACSATARPTCAESSTGSTPRSGARATSR